MDAEVASASIPTRTLPAVRKPRSYASTLNVRARNSAGTMVSTTVPCVVRYCDWNMDISARNRKAANSHEE